MSAQEHLVSVPMWPLLNVFLKLCMLACCNSAVTTVLTKTLINCLFWSLMTTPCAMNHSLLFSPLTEVVSDRCIPFLPVVDMWKISINSFLQKLYVFNLKWSLCETSWSGLLSLCLWLSIPQNCIRCMNLNTSFEHASKQCCCYLC